MTQGSDDDASKPSKGTDEGWDDLLGDAPAAPAAPTTPAAPVVPAPVAGRDPQKEPASGGPGASTSSGGSLFAPPSLAGAKVPTPAELDAAKADDDAPDEKEDADAAAPTEDDEASADRDDGDRPDEASADVDEDTAEDTADGTSDEAPAEETGTETDSTDDAKAEAAADAPASPPDEVDDEATVDAPLATETADAPPKAADTELPPKTAEAPQTSPKDRPKSAEARTKSTPPDDDDVELPPAAAPADDEEGSGWLWIIGLAAIAVVGFFVFRSGVTAYVPAGKVEADAASSHDEDEDPAETSGERAMEVRENSAANVVEPPNGEGDEADSGPTGPAAGKGADALEAGDAGDAGDDGSAPGDEAAEGEGSGTGTEASGTGDGDPRAVPAGTSEANAAAFAKIPVALSDRPPLVGVGANGIHIDEFDLGSKYEARKCKGAKSAFSVDDGQRANACFRVVHHREEDQVTVQWMKDGQLVRRNKVKVPDSHAYKTRASLALREEYVGNWTVQVVSSDDVVLAKGSFTVVE